MGRRVDMAGEAVRRCPLRAVGVKISSPDLGHRRVAAPLLRDRVGRCLLKRICSEDQHPTSGVAAAEAEWEWEEEVEVETTGIEVQIRDRVVGVQEGEVEDTELTVPSELVDIVSHVDNVFFST